MSFWSAVILLFLVLDPLGNVPIFVSVLARVEPRRRTRVVARELTIALAVLLVFLVAGEWVLRLLQVTDPALTIAGGVILFLIALRMIFAGPEAVFGEEPGEEPFIVPLAVPLVAGPSALAMVLLLVARDPARIAMWLAALLMAWFASSVILLLSAPLSRALGSRGLAAMARLMGLILVTVAVQLFLNGLRSFLHFTA
jgi:multiple antibiotic resistance protein